MNYIVAVDAGGTKTEAIAYDRDGRKITKALSGFGNPVMSRTSSLSHIKESIQSCIHACPNHCFNGIIAGVAGIEVGDNRDFLLNELSKEFHVPIILLNDAEISYYSILQGQDGILTIAGTGSISLGFSNGKKRVVGGWGHLLGDEGSAYDLAIQALKMAIHDFDTEKEPSQLTNALLNEMKVESVPGLKRFVYGSQKSEIAALAAVVGTYGQQGNAQAVQLLREAGTKLGTQTVQLIDQLQLTASIKVGLKGSVLEKNVIVSDTFKKVLLNRYSDVEFVTSSESATIGGYYYALKHHLF